LEKIGKDAFSECRGLHEIMLPYGLTHIDARAFYNCVGLHGGIEFPDTLTSIGPNAFRRCNGLQNVVFPKGLMHIGNSAFCGCINLKQIKFPDTLISIGPKAFSGCNSLQEVEFHPSLVSIGEDSFSFCESLHEVVLPALELVPKIKLIAMLKAFDHCSKLTTLIVLPPTSQSALQSASQSALQSTQDLENPWNGNYEQSYPLEYLSYYLPFINQVWAPDSTVSELGGVFDDYDRYEDLPLALQAAPRRIKSWVGVLLWRWYSPPISGNGYVVQFRSLSREYKSTVWVVLLICERFASDNASAIVPYGEIPIEIWMMIFGFYRRDLPATHLV
jgi:hypothetical protein